MTLVEELQLELATQSVAHQRRMFALVEREQEAKAAKAELEVARARLLNGHMDLPKLSGGGGAA